MLPGLTGLVQWREEVLLCKGGWLSQGGGDHRRRANTLPEPLPAWLLAHQRGSEPSLLGTRPMGQWMCISTHRRVSGHRLCPARLPVEGNDARAPRAAPAGVLTAPEAPSQEGSGSHRRPSLPLPPLDPCRQMPSPHSLAGTDPAPPSTSPGQDRR